MDRKGVYRRNGFNFIYFNFRLLKKVSFWSTLKPFCFHGSSGVSVFQPYHHHMIRSFCALASPTKVQAVSFAGPPDPDSFIVPRSLVEKVIQQAKIFWRDYPGKPYSYQDTELEIQMTHASNRRDHYRVEVRYPHVYELDGKTPLQIQANLTPSLGKYPAHLLSESRAPYTSGIYQQNMGYLAEALRALVGQSW